MGIALMAVFALGAIASATASAENPEILPIPTAKAPLKFTSAIVKGTTARLVTTKDLEIVCVVLKNKGEFTSQDKGTATLEFEECKSKGVSCNTEGDAKGLLLITAPIFLVAFKEGAELRLGLGVNLLEKNVVIKCGSGTFTIEVKGDVLGKVDNIKSLVKTTTAQLLFNQVTLGEQNLTTCELLKATCGSALKLEATFGSGFELAAQIVEDNVTFEKEAEVHF